MNLIVMQVVDQQFLGTPFYGVQPMTLHLQKQGHPASEPEAYPAPDADLPEAQHQQACHGAQAPPLPAWWAAGR